MRATCESKIAGTRPVRKQEMFLALRRKRGAFIRKSQFRIFERKIEKIPEGTGNGSRKRNEWERVKKEMDRRGGRSKNKGET